MQSDSVYQKYHDEVIILLGTGLRISELCGLTETDLDFENRVINVDHQHNKCHEEALPKVMTPHTLRHTFCTNLVNAGMNPKALQYIMGHSNITMTLNYYAHATFASAKADCSITADGFTTSFTTIEGENLKGFESI
jgi:integrase